MAYVNGDALVSTDWLADHLSDESVVVLDGSYHLPTVKRDADAEYAEGHIPGARRFNIDVICDPDDPLPHMVPEASQFAEQVGLLGISNRHKVVVYDVYGMQSAARVWWMFRLFGHDDVAVLNGGLPKWNAEGRTLSADTPSPTAQSFQARFRPELVRSVDQMLDLANGKGGETIVDVRAAGRFTATEPEPRPGMRSGHMPGALNLPFGGLLDPADKTFLPADAIRERVDAAGIQFDTPIASSCGSGVTACILALALHLIGKEDVAVYDGSWSEWGGRQDTPIVTD